jgi:hypothetical protein
MGLRIEARIPNAKDAIGRLKGLKRASIEELDRAMRDILDESIEVFRAYPPETDGNNPPPPYYKRGTGMMQRIAGGGEAVRENRASDQLGERWAYNVVANENGVNARIGNSATNPGHVPYAGYVHGSPDNDPPQTLFHKAHQWPVAKDVIEEKIKEESPRITRMMRAIKNFFDRG